MVRVSFRQSMLAGFLLIVVFLGWAGVRAWVLLERFAAQSRANGEIALQLSATIQELGERSVELERSARQFMVLNDRTVLARFDAQVFRSLTAIERLDLTEDARFKENWDRVKNRAALAEVLRPIFGSKSRDEWLAILSRHEVIAAPVLSIKDSLDFFSARIPGLVIETQHDKLGSLREVRAPIRFSSDPPTVHRATPVLGRDTQQRLLKAGFTEAQIDEWRAKRLV